MTKKEAYIEFLEEYDLPIFNQDWWLDAVCSDGKWDVEVFKLNNKIIAVIPYYIVKRFLFFRIIRMPQLTQTLGPYIVYPSNQNHIEKLALEKKVMLYLIDKLPFVHEFIQTFHYSQTNWLPFYWSGYKQTTKYTYIIDNKSIESITNNLTKNTKRRIKKAYNSGVQILESSDVEEFYKINKKTFDRKKMNIPYSFEFIEKLYNICQKKDAVKIYLAKYNDKIIAGVFLVYDKKTVYALMAGIDIEYANLGAMDAIHFEGICFAVKTNRIYNFEGSMIEGIEKYFRSFGAEQKQYFKIFKINSYVLKLKKCFIYLKSDNI